MAQRIPAYRGDEEFFFVSYANANRDVVQGYLRAFHEHGYRFWYDFELTGGKSWAAELEERIRACRLLLVFLTDASVDSEWVQKEVNLALELKKPVVCVYLERTELRHGLGLQLRNTQGVNAFDLSRAEAGAKLQRAIDTVLDAPAAAERTLSAPARYRLAARSPWPYAVMAAAALAFGVWQWAKDDGAAVRDIGQIQEPPPKPVDYTARLAQTQAGYRAEDIAVRKLLETSARLREEFAEAVEAARAKRRAVGKEPENSAERLRALGAAREAMKTVRVRAEERARALARSEKEAAETATRQVRDRLERSWPRPEVEAILERHCAGEYAALRAAHSKAQAEFTRLVQAPLVDPALYAELRERWSGALKTLGELKARAVGAECERLLGDAGRAVTELRADEAKSALRRVRELAPDGDAGDGFRKREADLQRALREAGSVNDFVLAIAADLERMAGPHARDVWLDFELRNGLDRLVYERVRDRRSEEQWRLRTRRCEWVLRIRIEAQEGHGARWRVATYELIGGKTKHGSAQVVLAPSDLVARALGREPGVVEDEPAPQEAYSAHLVTGGAWPRGWWPPSADHAKRLRWKRAGVLGYRTGDHESEMELVTVNRVPCLVDRAVVSIGRYRSAYLKGRKHLASVRKHWGVEGGLDPQAIASPLTFVTLPAARLFAKAQGLDLPLAAERRAAGGGGKVLEWCNVRAGQDDGPGRLEGGGKSREIPASQAANMDRNNIGFRCVLRLVR